MGGAQVQAFYDFDLFFKNIREFTQLAKSELSKKQLSKLPTTTARSINIYFKETELTRDDRFEICRVLKPDGWRDSFNDKTALLDARENELREKLLRSRVKFPTIKVSLVRNRSS